MRIVPTIVLFACVLAAGGCAEQASPSADPRFTIELRWLKAYPNETRDRVETGLLWTLSFLGAALPRDARLLSWHDNVATLHLDLAGIDERTLPYWERLVAVLKASDEYKAAGAIDIGRFSALTLCSSRHYYALTGAAAGYEQARAPLAFDERRVAIVESAVSPGNRLIEIVTGAAVTDIAFVAHEGPGSIEAGTFVGEDHELLAVMPNGQLRFALYGQDGELEPAAHAELTPAAKPAKCLWCHETHVLRPYKARTAVPGHYSPAEFETEVAGRMERLRVARSRLASHIDFRHEENHTLAELLYLSFYEPSAERVAQEWGMPVAQVRQMLAGLPTHVNAEFAFLGTALYRRSDVDGRAPRDALAVPADPREPSQFEPDLLR